MVCQSGPGALAEARESIREVRRTTLSRDLLVTWQWDESRYQTKEVIQSGAQPDHGKFKPSWTSNEGGNVEALKTIVLAT